MRFLADAIQHVSSYAEFELLLEIAFALANDHGRKICITPFSYNHSIVPTSVN